MVDPCSKQYKTNPECHSIPRSINITQSLSASGTRLTPHAGVWITCGHLLALLWNCIIYMGDTTKTCFDQVQHSLLRCTTMAMIYTVHQRRATWNTGFIRSFCQHKPLQNDCMWNASVIETHSIWILISWARVNVYILVNLVQMTGTCHRYWQYIKIISSYLYIQCGLISLHSPSNS